MLASAAQRVRRLGARGHVECSGAPSREDAHPVRIGGPRLPEERGDEVEHGPPQPRAAECVPALQRRVEVLVGHRVAAEDRGRAAGLDEAAVHHEVRVAAVGRRAERAPRRVYALHVPRARVVEPRADAQVERAGEPRPGRVESCGKGSR